MYSAITSKIFMTTWPCRRQHLRLEIQQNATWFLAVRECILIRRCEVWWRRIMTATYDDIRVWTLYILGSCHCQGGWFRMSGECPTLILRNWLLPDEHLLISYLDALLTYLRHIEFISDGRRVERSRLPLPCTLVAASSVLGGRGQVLGEVWGSEFMYMSTAKYIVKWDVPCAVGALKAQRSTGCKLAESTNLMYSYRATDRARIKSMLCLHVFKTLRPPCCTVEHRSYSSYGAPMDVMSWGIDTSVLKWSKISDAPRGIQLLGIMPMHMMIINRPCQASSRHCCPPWETEWWLQVYYTSCRWVAAKRKAPLPPYLAVQEPVNALLAQQPTEILAKRGNFQAVYSGPIRKTQTLILCIHIDIKILE